MATMVHTLGVLTAFHLASNLDSLANNACKPLGGLSAGAPYVDNSTLKYPSANLYFLFNLAATGMIPGGTIEIYLLKCLTTPGTLTNWSEGLDPAGVADIAPNIFNVAPLVTLKANDSMNGLDIILVLNDIAYATLKDVEGINRVLGELPPYWTLAVWNKSGAALAAAGNVAQYQLKTYGSA